MYPNPHYWSSICVTVTSPFLLETTLYINIILNPAIHLIIARSNGVLFIYLFFVSSGVGLPQRKQQRAGKLKKKKKKKNRCNILRKFTHIFKVFSDAKIHFCLMTANSLPIVLAKQEKYGQLFLNRQTTPF